MSLTDAICDRPAEMVPNPVVGRDAPRPAAQPSRVLCQVTICQAPPRLA